MSKDQAGPRHQQRSARAGRLTDQVAGLRTALQQTLPFKIAANALCEALRQLGEFGAHGHVDPAEANRTGESDEIDTSSEVGRAPGAVMAEVDEIAKAAFRSITVDTMLKLIERRRGALADTKTAHKG
jgi:hypothetical protein